MNIAVSAFAPARQNSRKRVLLKAQVISHEGQREVRIRDLSDRGVQVVWGELPLPQGDVIFKLGETFAAARVAWAKPGEAGLEFYRALDPSELPRR